MTDLTENSTRLRTPRSRIFGFGSVCVGIGSLLASLLVIAGLLVISGLLGLAVADDNLIQSPSDPDEPATTAPEKSEPSPAAVKPSSEPTDSKNGAVVQSFGDAVVAVKRRAMIRGPYVRTIFDKDHSGMPTAVKDGELVFGENSVQTIPLDEIAFFSPDHQAKFTVRWVGQDGRDVAQPLQQAEGQGIEDIHLQLDGLRLDSPIREITVQAHGSATWRLSQVVQHRPSLFSRFFGNADSSTTPDEKRKWRAQLERMPHSHTADLFIDPNGPDRFEQTFRVTVAYENGQADFNKVNATTHTDETRKLADAAGKAAELTATPQVLVFLENDDRLHGRLLAVDAETIIMQTTWKQKIRIPLLQIKGLCFAKGTEQQGRFIKQLPLARTSDVVLVLARDGSVTQIEAEIQKIDAGKLRVRFGDRDRGIDLSRLVGISLASHPPVRDLSEAYQIFQVFTGDVVLGRWTAIGETTYRVETPFGESLEIPRQLVSRVDFRNGRRSYLSDMTPSLVEHTPYFDRKTPHHLDQTTAGKPIRLAGKTYPKGIAVHARTVLSYRLDKQYESFQTILAFDPQAATQGRVRCRVLGDGKTLFEASDLRAGEPPKRLSLSVVGIRRLTLEVDFGKNEDIGDRILWADAQLLRAKSP